MLDRKYLWAGVLTSLGAAALAHNGATGVVMDRMMGMTAMKDVMASLAPMMQGQKPYEVATVQENAAKILAHSGENLVRLFPEGSLQPSSFAKPDIWEEWEDFEALSKQLETYAMGLATAAPNGLTAPTIDEAAPSSGTMDHSMMQMDASSEASDASGGSMMDHSAMNIGASSEAAAMESPATMYSVAELMGVSRPPSSVQPATGAGMERVIDFSLLAADDVFETLSQTCSSCHARFRMGS